MPNPWEKREDKKARETGLEKTLTPTLMDGLFAKGEPVPVASWIGVALWLG